MKGFIHIYEVEDDLEHDFKQFCLNNTGGNYKFGLRFLLSFHKSFKDVLKVLSKEQGVTIEKNIEVKE